MAVITLAASAQFPRVTAAHASIVDAPGPASYPIAGYSWALVRSRLADTTHRRAVAALFRWVVTAGQRYAAAAHYVPLPASVQAEANRALDRIAP
jgi:phosphate transport system substrate-binding protein